MQQALAGRAQPEPAVSEDESWHLMVTDRGEPSLQLAGRPA